jgi:predicted DNA-binding protein (UPF0251 family)
MPRPRQCRRVAGLPQVTYYKPRGIPLAVLQCVDLTVDEFEALRLADWNICTGGCGSPDERVRARRSAESGTARAKVADALVNGKAASPSQAAPSRSRPPMRRRYPSRDRVRPLSREDAVGEEGADGLLKDRPLKSPIREEPEQLSPLEHS